MIPHEDSCSEGDYENGEFLNMLKSKQPKKPDGIVNLGHQFTAEVNDDDDEEGYDEAYQVIDDSASDEESDYINFAGAFHD